jgi:hypothetical protein
MAFLNFLTQGQPLPSTTSSLTTSQVPQYLSDYLYNLMSGAYSAAQEEYIPYTTETGAAAPRIAGFTPEQQKAFEMTTGPMATGPTAPGQFSLMAPPPEGYGPEYGDALPLPSGYGPAPSAPSPSFGGGAATAYMPQLRAAEQTAQQAGGISAMGAAQPYFNQASQTLPSTIQNYMNPYQQNVIDTMGTEAQRQLQEKILPAIGDQFTRAGQFGSSRQQEIAQRGVRDVASDLEANIGKQLALGYTTAGQQAQADLARQASIGQAAGTLAGTEAQQKAALANVQAGLGQKEQALGLTGAAATETVGAQQQAMNQKNLDLAYSDFLQQRDYPKQQLSYLSNIVRGLPAGGSTTSGTISSMGQSYSASPLASLASAGLSAAALGNLLK